MIAKLVLALALAAPFAAGTPQTVDLAGPTPNLEFRIDNLGPWTVHGVAHGAPGLDYSAGVSVTSLPSGPVVHRLILDRTHHVYFGYDLVLSGTGSGSVHLRFGPLSDTRGFHFDAAHFRPARMDPPSDRTVRPDQPEEVVLETGPSGQITLSDSLSIRIRP